MSADDVGDIKKIGLRHDNAGLAAGWFVEKVGKQLSPTSLLRISSY